MLRTRLALFSFLLALSVAATGCLGGLTGTGSRSGTGTLAVYLTDAPDDTIKEVWVTVTSVQAHRDGAWHTVHDFGDEPLSVDLLQLRFDEALLGEALLPAGAYTQLRLIVDDSSIDASHVRHQDDSVSYLKVPSGAQTGLKIHHNFIIPTGGTVELLLDVNVVNFITKAGASGMYLMNPTAVRVVHRTEAGAIAGRVLGAGEDEEAEPALIEDRQVTITVRDDSNQVVAQSLALPGDDGYFQVNAVPTGVYTVVIEADNEGADVAYLPQTFANVAVHAGATTSLNDGEDIVLERDDLE